MRLLRLVMTWPLLLLVASAAAAEARAQDSGPAAAARGWRVSAADALAVQTERRSTAWLTAGVGVATRGAAGAVGASYQFGGNLLSMRAAGTVAFFGDDLWDIGLLYGRATRPGFMHVSVAAGVAAVGGTRREGSLFDPAETIPTTIGFPIEVQLFFRPLPVVGLGLYGFANFNDEESFQGIAGAVQLGRLR
jgi:hypothetical protein